MRAFSTLAMLCLATFAGACSDTQAQWDLPPVFSTLGFDKALAQNKSSDKILVVKATATWCAPCKQMDRTTWRDEKVVAWFGANGVAIEFDVDKERALAKSLEIQAMPTMIAFKKGEQFDRIVGFRDAPDLLAWVEGVKNGKKSIEAVRSKVQQSEQGSIEEIKSRYELAKHLAQTGEPSKACEEYLWLWAHMPGTSYSSVRVSFMANDMEQLAARHASVKSRFQSVRNESGQHIDGEQVDHDELIDWIVLNNVVGESEKTLEWFDKVKLEPRWSYLLRRSSYLLKRLLIAKERWADLALLHPDPVADLQQTQEMHATFAQARATHPSGENASELEKREWQSFRTEAGQVYAAMLAGARAEDAQAVVKKAIEFDDSGAMRAELVRWALKAKQARAEQGALLDDAEQKGGADSIRSLREELTKALAAAH